MSRQQGKGKGKRGKSNNLRRVKRAKIGDKLTNTERRSEKKYVQNSYFFAVILPKIPSPIGDLKIPSGTAPGPQGFSNPLWAQGIWGKIPLKKSEFYI